MPAEAASRRPTALQTCDVFVGRTTNWLYDHLRFVPDYEPLVLCEELANREEFSELEAWETGAPTIPRRAWRRLAPERVFPPDLWRLARRRPCVLHTHFGNNAVADEPLRRALGIPWLVGFYGADVYQLGRVPVWRERYARVFERATRVLALGPVMARRLEALGCPREKVVVHALGVDVSGIRTVPRELRPGGRLRVLFAGTFREKKGIQYVVEALHLARRAGADVELHLVGDSGGKEGDQETKEEVFRLIHEHDLEEHIHHHRWMTFSQLLLLASRSHVFVAPSVTSADGDAEGTPFVIQQMMATGIAVVSTRHSDIPFLFGDHAKLLVPERDAASIADRLRCYGECPDQLTTDGLDLAAQIRGNFDVRDRACALARIYDEVTGETAAPPLRRSA